MQHDTVDTSLSQQAYEFFFWFSRFEAALKENGYLQSERPGDRAEPGWQRFVQKWEHQYVPSTEALRLVALAPAKQVVGANKSLTWAQTAVPQGASQLAASVLMLKTVRNNLFHGGKHGSLDWDDPQRTHQLLAAARPILDELAQLAGLDADYHQIY